MQDKEIRIYPERREEIDAERIARALLSLIGRLTPEQKEVYLKEGEKLMRELHMTVPGRRSAA
jgi:hypothetical protein